MNLNKKTIKHLIQSLFDEQQYSIESYENVNIFAVAAVYSASDDEEIIDETTID